MIFLVLIKTNNRYLEELERYLNSLGYLFSVELLPGLGEFDVIISIYCKSRNYQEKVIFKLSESNKEIFKTEDIKFSLISIQDQDWQEAWKEHFKPIQIGRLNVCISEKEFSADKDKLNIIIDPGMAFGNGSHPTTKGCLFFIDKYLEQGMKVLDFGTGSGVLAIACDKLGASQIDAIDNDDQAVEMSRRNVHSNKAKNVRVLHSDEFSIQDDYQLIVANITADVIIKHFKYLTEKQNSLRFIIFSGISDYRKAQIDVFFMTEDIKPIEVYESEGWYTYIIKK